jgi:transposase
MSRDLRCDVERVAMKTPERSSQRRRQGRSQRYRWRVSDELWAKLEPLLQDPPRRLRYPGRCRYPARQCLEGILYVLFTDTPWLEVPYRELGLPSGETCRRRLEEWERRGLLETTLHVLQHQLAGADRLDWSRVIVDASTVDAKKGARRSRARSWADRGVVITWQ